MRIGLDAMGGDMAPGEIIAGALASLDELNGDQLVLFGDEAAILDCLGDPSRWREKISIQHAPEIVAMDDPPVEALRKKRRSSIALMAKAAAQGELDVVISAGNTGAYVAACQLRMRTLPGVLRPGITVVFPTFAGDIDSQGYAEDNSYSNSHEGYMKVGQCPLYQQFWSSDYEFPSFYHLTYSFPLTFPHTNCYICFKILWIK